MLLSMFSGIVIVTVFLAFLMYGQFDHSTSVSEMFWKFILLDLIVIMMITWPILLVTKRLTKKIIEPINQFTFNGEQEIYHELSPFIKKISQQKEQIHLQLESLANRSATIEAITTSMKEGLIVVNEEGSVVIANKSAMDFLGVSSIEPGQNMLEVARNIEIHQCIKASLEGISSNIEINLASRVINFFFSPAPSVGTVILMVDITEKFQAETMRREFSANVSHELKTPLTTISGYAEMLETDMVQAENIGPFAGKIRSESVRLIHLIEDIIRLSQLDEENPLDAITTFDFAELIEEVIHQITFKADQALVTIEQNLASSKITANRQLIFDMVYNLLGNAIKYNKVDGSIRIRLLEEEKQVKLMISDTGIGIPEEHLDRVFERFYRIDSSRSKKTGGTGLGLSIVKHIVQYHKGTVEIESRENVGTTITVRLPVCFD